MAATHVLQRRLERAVSRFVCGEGTTEAAFAVLADAGRWGITPATDGVARRLQDALVQAVAGIANGEVQVSVARAHAILDVAHALALTLNTWEAQNQYYVLITTDRERRWPGAVLGEIRRLGERLSFHLREWEALAARAA